MSINQANETSIITSIINQEDPVLWCSVKRNLSCCDCSGFFPQTLCGDGDPLDVLVMGDLPLVPGSIVDVRPIAYMVMEDEKGMDEKVISSRCLCNNTRIRICANNTYM